MSTPTLFDLARKIDSLDPETAWKERLDLAEQMKAQLGKRHEEFDRRYEGLLRKTPAHASPAVVVLEKMGLVATPAPSPNAQTEMLDLPLQDEPPAAPAENDPTEAPAWVRPLITSTMELAAQEVLEQLDRLPAGVRDQAISEISRRVTSALMLVLEDGLNIPTDKNPEDLAAEYLRRAKEAERPHVNNPAGSAQEPGAPLTEAERIAQAASAYRAWRTLSLAPHVGVEELAKASLAWTTARDSFEKGSAAAARLKVATAEIDREIEEEKQRPARYPNQLPGAIPVP